MATKTLNVNSFDNTQADWLETGSSPYLDTNDGDTSKISEDTINIREKYFGFENLSGSIASISSVVLYVVAKCTLSSNWYEIDVIDKATETLLMNNKRITGATYSNYTADITSTIDTLAKINAFELEIYGQSQGLGATIHITHVYIIVTYTRGGVAGGDIDGDISIGGNTIADETILAINLHLGCTNEVSTYEIIIDRGNPSYDNSLDPGEGSALTNGDIVLIDLGRSSKPRLLTGILEEIEYIDEVEEFNFRNIVRCRGRCNGYQLFAKKFDGDLITLTGSTDKAYRRTAGEAEGMIAYIIDNYTSLSHSRVNSLLTGTTVASGQKVVPVTDGTKFATDDLVKIYDDTAWEYNKVASVSSNNVTMVSDLNYTYVIADNAVCALDLIKTTSTSYTQLQYIYTTIFEIIKFIADTADLSGTIGYDFRIEYDGKFAFFSRESIAESYSLQDDIQFNSYLKTIGRVKNKITVFGKADKPYPLDADGQEWADGWTELATPSNIVSVAADAAASQKVVEVAEDASDAFSVGDYLWITEIVDGENELVQIASINKPGGANDEITMESVLSHGYATAQAAILYEVSTTSRWGFKPDTGGATDDISIVQDTTDFTRGSKSVEVVGANSRTQYNIWCTMLASEKFSMNDYFTLKFDIHFETTAPATVDIKLYSGDAGSTDYALYKTQFRFTTADKWERVEINGGTNNASKWVVGSGFDWTDISSIEIKILYAAGGNNTIFIDELYLVGKQWGGGTDDATVDGFAEDSSSQTSYGIREHVFISDLLLSDAECEFKAQGLKYYYKAERLTIEVQTDTLDYEAYHPMAGNTVASDLDLLGVTGSSYRIDSIDLMFRASNNTLTLVFILDRTPVRIADYLHGIRQKVAELVRKYNQIR